MSNSKVILMVNGTKIELPKDINSGLTGNSFEHCYSPVPSFSEMMIKFDNAKTIKEYKDLCIELNSNEDCYSLEEMKFALEHITGLLQKINEL